MAVSSYGDQHKIFWICKVSDLDADVADRYVLIVEFIIDSGPNRPGH